MKIKNLQINKALRTVLFVLLLCAAGMTKAQTENITFADANVKAICVANWDTDGDGELNTTEAAAVTNLDGMFMFDDGITSFNELQFFTGLTSFGEDEFNSCTSLASITIPNAVTSIGSYAFSDCSSLTSMTSYACTPPALGNEVFYNVPSILVLNVPCHTSAMYQEADGWSDFTNYEEFEYGLCPIPFADATAKAICVAHWDTNEDGELSYAEAAAVTNLGTYFKSTAITAFDELEYFTSLTSLPNTAFYGCTSLASITLPASVSALGNGSFYNCTNLATMTVFAETPPTVGTNAFKNVPIDMAVYVPCGTYVAYHTAYGWSEFTILQQSGSCPIVFADANVKALCVANWDTNGDGELSYDEAATVTDLEQVFRNQSITSFDELQYFINLTSIGDNEFHVCNSLTSIIIPNSVTTIGWCAFQDCRSLISFTIPNSVTSVEANAFLYCTALEQMIVELGNGIYDSRENCNAIIETASNKLIFGCKNTVIPNTVTSIGEYAFQTCESLTSIVIPNSVTSIGYYAFGYCSGLISITIPNSVTSVEANAFRYCTALEQMIVESGNTIFDSRENCNAIIETASNKLIFGCKNTVIPNTVTSIGNSAFETCSGLTTIEIPNSVISIGNYAFYQCRGLRFMYVLSETPPNLGNSAFPYSRLSSVYVPCNAVQAYQSASGWSNFNNILGLCSGEVTVIINPSDGGTVIGAGYYSGGEVCVLSATATPGYVFTNWTENGKVVSMDSVLSFYAHPTTIEANFSSNSPITFADANVKALCVANWDTNGDGELSYAEAGMVTDLGEVFRNKQITSFNELQYFVNLSSIGDYEFYACSGLTSIIMPNSVTTIGSYAFNFCYCLTSIQISNAVISIDSYAFGSCHNLTSIEFPNSLIGITNFAFNYCTGLTTIIIPKSVTSIGSFAFDRCSGIEQIMVDLENSVYDSRDNCNAIINTNTNELVIGCKNTIIPNSVTSISSSAFYRCSGLTSIKIPNSVTSIGSYAFYECSGLNSFTSFAETPPILGSSVFYAVNKSIPVYIPYGTIGVYQAAEGWSEFNNYIEMCPGTITVAALPEEGGMVTGGGSYEGGATCTLSATANEGYTFMYWTENGNQVSSNVCFSFTVIGDRNLVANFALPFTITASANPIQGGTITGAGTHNYGTTATLLVSANSGYNFLNWTENGEVVSFDEEYSFLVSGDRSLVANFIAMPPMPVVAEYYPDPNEPNSPYVKVHWAASSFEAMIGDEVSSAYTAYMPFYTLYDNSISEALYTASELSEAGVTAGPITSLSWEAVSVTTNQPQNNISIWMANVSDTELTTTSHLASNMTLVYTGNIGIPPLGWNEFVFNESNFVWDGTSNVLILCQRNNGQWNGSVYWRSHNPGFYGMAYKYRDGTPYDVTSQTYALTLSNTVRPNIIMKGEGPMTYSLYRANCDGTNAQLIAENLDDTQYIDETWWQLENDSYKYGVSIADSTSTDIFWSNCIEKQGNMAAQTITLFQGWNWVSLSVEAGDPVELLQMLEAALGDNAVQIQSFDDNTEFDGEEWFGGLDDTGISNAQMYMIEVVNDCTVELQGTPANPADYEIYIEPGQWNWIGFPCTVELGIAEALANFEPEEADQIQAGNIMTEFDGEEWFGDFETLVPGQGYMYFSNSSETKILVFSTTAKGKSVILRKEKN